MSLMRQIGAAIRSLSPGAEYTFDGVAPDDNAAAILGKLIWHSGSRPTNEAILAEVARLEGAPPVPKVISRRQFYQGLAVAEYISKADALAAIKTGTIPPALQELLDAMTDPDEQFAADMLLSGATEFRRDHPLVAVIATAQGLTPAEVDDFWRLCAGLQRLRPASAGRFISDGGRSRPF